MIAVILQKSMKSRRPVLAMSERVAEAVHVRQGGDDGALRMLRLVRVREARDVFAR